MYNDIVKKIEINLTGIRQGIVIWLSNDSDLIVDTWRDRLDCDQHVEEWLTKTYGDPSAPFPPDGCVTFYALCIFSVPGENAVPSVLEMLQWEATLIASTILSERAE